MGLLQRHIVQQELLGGYFYQKANMACMSTCEAYLVQDMTQVELILRGYKVLF